MTRQSMSLIQRFTNARRPGSLSNRLRSRRFRLFKRLVGTLPRPLRIIDLGGTAGFWEHRGWADRNDVEITTVNYESDAAVREVRLMTRSQLRRLFPDAVIHAERFGGLVKSWIVHAGFPPVHQVHVS